MLIFILDVIFGYFIGDMIKKLWLSILLSIAGGTISAAGGAYLAFHISGQVFDAERFAVTLLDGAVFHVIAVIVIMVLARRKAQKAWSM